MTEDFTRDMRTYLPGSSKPSDQGEGQLPDDAVPQSMAAPYVDGYEMIEEIGHGGMGRVWAALQLGTQRKVAVKLLPPFSSPVARARFEREIRLAGKLKHPNIVSIYAGGTYRGDFYYVMEYVDGIHLDKYVAGRKLGDLGIVRLMGKVCRAVEHAHQFGIIHRDLKPQNILVTEDGEPHIVDFGLAKQDMDDSSEISIRGEVAGTLVYMSPEQASGLVDSVSTRSDVYSLGVILYVLLTGKFTHFYDNPVDIVRLVSQEEVVHPRLARPEIDVRLGNVLLKALDLQPGRRYASAGELAQDLENYPDGVMIAQPLSGREIILRHIRKYYAPVGVGTALFSLVVVILAMNLLNTRHVNTLSLFDLIAFMVTFPIAVMFLLAYFVIGKRTVDLTFGLLMLLIALNCIPIFLSDNIVPDGALAVNYRHRAEWNLILSRTSYLLGMLAIPVNLHFILVYCGWARWPRWKAVSMYLAFYGLCPVIFSPWFLRERNVPLEEYASPWCMVPWMPETGILAVFFLVAWLATQVFAQIALLQRKRNGGSSTKGPLSQLRTIRIGLAVEGAGVVIDCLMVQFDIGSISTYPFTSLAVGLIFGAALVRERITSDLSAEQRNTATVM